MPSIAKANVAAVVVTIANIAGTVVFIGNGSYWLACVSLALGFFCLLVLWQVAKHEAGIPAAKAVGETEPARRRATEMANARSNAMNPNTRGSNILGGFVAILSALMNLWVAYIVPTFYIAGTPDFKIGDLLIPVLFTSPIWGLLYGMLNELSGKYRPNGAIWKWLVDFGPSAVAIVSIFGTAIGVFVLGQGAVTDLELLSRALLIALCGYAIRDILNQLKNAKELWARIDGTAIVELARREAGEGSASGMTVGDRRVHPHHAAAARGGIINETVVTTYVGYVGPTFYREDDLDRYLNENVIEHEPAPAREALTHRPERPATPPAPPPAEPPAAEPHAVATGDEEAATAPRSTH